MLVAVQPLFFDRGHQLAVLDQDGGGVSVEGIQAQDIHRRVSIEVDLMAGRSNVRRMI
jgi:hypothetical protein